MEKRYIHKHGMEGLKLGIGRRPLCRGNRASIGEAMKLRMELKQRIEGRRCSSDCLLPVAHVMSVRHFTPGQWVMVAGKTTARGFQGLFRGKGRLDNCALRRTVSALEIVV